MNEKYPKKTVFRDHSFILVCWLLFNQLIDFYFLSAAVQHERLAHQRHNSTSSTSPDHNNNNELPNIFFPQFSTPTEMSIKSRLAPHSSSFQSPLSQLTTNTTHPTLIPPFSPSFNTLLPSIIPPPPPSTQKTPSPPKKDAPHQAPPSPVTPLSKNSEQYSIDNLLKDKKETTPPHANHHPAMLLTPPSSPQYLLYHQMKFNVELEANLMKILEDTIRRVNSVPAFVKMNKDIRSQLLETSWLPLLLLGLFESNFPVQSFISYLLNTVSQRLSPHEIPHLHNISVSLERLRQCSVDKIELDLLKLYVLFNPGKLQIFSILDKNNS